MSDPCEPFPSLSSPSPFDFSSSLQLARHQIFNERQPKPSRAPYRCSKYHPPPSCKLIPGLIFYLCLKTVICIMLNIPFWQQKSVFVPLYNLEYVRYHFPHYVFWKCPWTKEVFSSRLYNAFTRGLLIHCNTFESIVSWLFFIQIISFKFN